MLKVLLVEDSAADAELIRHQMRSDQLAVHTKRVQTTAELVNALEEQDWDVVLADYKLPELDAFEVLELIQRRESDLPVILVTGALPEEKAVEFIKKGGDDFILKSSLKRLGSAVTKALQRRNVEREKRRAEASLRESEERLKLVMDGVQDYAMCMLDAKGNVLTWNSAAEQIFGYATHDIIGRHFSIFFEAGQAERLKGYLEEALARGRYETDCWLPHRNREKFYGNVVIAPLRDSHRQLHGFSHVVRDITERKRGEEALKKSHDQLRALAGKLQSLRESEASRIAREIHDELGQSLTAIKIELSRIVQKLDAKGEPLAAKLHATVDLTNATIQSVQRLVTELRPRLLDELGLTDAIRCQVREYQNRTGIHCQFLSRVKSRSCSGEISTAMFRIVQETLTNVARHAHATRVNISLKAIPGSLRLVICDNGRGIRTSELQRPTSLGILGMRERTQLLGGCFDIYSTRGHGTQVTVTLPLTPPAPA